MEGIVDDFGETGGGRDVVGNSTDGDGGSASLSILPFAKNTHQNVGGGTVVQQLTDKVEIGNKGRLQNDGHVGSVEQFDGVGPLLSAVLLVLDGKNHSPSLEVDDHDENEEGGKEIGQVGKILSEHRLLDGADLIIPSNEEMEQCHDSSLELGPPTSIDGGRTEGLPNNILADISRNEQGDTAAQSIPLL